MTLQTTNLFKNLFLFESQLHESRRLGSLGGMLLGNRKKIGRFSERVDPPERVQGFRGGGQVSLGSPTHGSGDSFCDSLWGSDLGFFITWVRKITWIVLNVEKKNWTRPFFWHFDPWSLSKTFLRSIILITVGERIWRFEGWTAKRANLSNPSPPYDHHRA